MRLVPDHKKGSVVIAPETKDDLYTLSLMHLLVASGRIKSKVPSKADELLGVQSYLGIHVDQQAVHDIAIETNTYTTGVSLK